jgi:predicted Zn-dependent protease
MSTIQMRNVMDSVKELMHKPKTSHSVLDIMIEAGYLLGCTGQHHNAEEVFRSIVAVYPDGVGGWLGLGNVLLMQGMIEQSEEAYEKVLENDPSDPAARAFLGELYLCSGRLNEGRKMLDSVFRDYPDSQVGLWAWNLLQLCGELNK